MENALKIKLKKILLPLLPAALFMLLILSAARVKESCFEAILLCGRLIIPSLFPFFVMSAFLTKLGLPGVIGRVIAPIFSRVYGISPAGASALLMGLIGGYPTGAAYIADMEHSGSINAAEGERLVAFCNNSGPSFIIGVMGLGIFGSVRVGLKLYAVHIFAALVTGLFFRSKDYSRGFAAHRLDSSNTAEALVESIKQSVINVMNVCGFVISFSVLMCLMDTANFFTLLCACLSSFFSVNADFIRALLTAVFELGTASGAMQLLSSSPASLALAAGALSWGGLSVHFQTLAVLSKSKIKGALHLTGRLISALIASTTMLIISLF